MTGFLLAGIGVELIGLTLVFRSHIPPKLKNQAPKREKEGQA
jgi:hypothetical protein